MWPLVLHQTAEPQEDLWHVLHDLFCIFEYFTIGLFGVLLNVNCWDVCYITNIFYKFVNCAFISAFISVPVFSVPFYMEEAYTLLL